MVKVSNMTSPRSGEAVKNQFVIHDLENGVVYFQSYGSLIASYDGRRLVLGRHFDYSVTTSKYLHKWINEWVKWDIANAILDARGNSYSEKLRDCIARGIIEYRGDMV